ncbi:glycosyltransferase [Sinorhizobium fredii]|uniref:Glycosyltransferase family 1 protein n=1 Tax=Rhizobium fredii TaxID=380 RepID=A0A2L0HG23_RHIFR|nr:glycosyltransferase [Sinorhizobium fredii]AUX80448.1 glycosyltransferase family 1 protein [Sinorhizobium fredii]
MKIGLYCPAMTRIRGGIERLAADLAWAFEEQSWSTVIYTHNRGDAAAVTPVYDLPVSAEVVPLNFRDQPEFGSELRHAIQTARPDVVCVMDVVPAFWHFIRAVKDLNIPLVLSEHFAPSISETNFRDPRVRRAAFSCADLIHLLVPSHADTVDFEDRDRTHVIPNPVVPPARRADAVGQNVTRKRFINVARIHFAQKAQDVLVEAFSSIASEIPEWDLLCVGNAHNADEERKFRELVDRFGLKDRVVWNGGLEHDRLYDALSESQVFVLPSWFEGSPISLAEGLAHGLPAIGFEKCEGTNQLIRGGANGLLAPGLGDPRSLSRAMLQLAKYPRLREAYSAKAEEIKQERAKTRLLGRWVGLMREAKEVTLPRLSKLGSGELRYDDAVAARLSGEKILGDVRAISVPGKAR